MSPDPSSILDSVFRSVVKAEKTPNSTILVLGAPNSGKETLVRGLQAASKDAYSQWVHKKRETALTGALDFMYVEICNIAEYDTYTGARAAVWLLDNIDYREILSPRLENVDLRYTAAYVCLAGTNLFHMMSELSTWLDLLQQFSQSKLTDIPFDEQDSIRRKLADSLGLPEEDIAYNLGFPITVIVNRHEELDKLEPMVQQAIGFHLRSACIPYNATLMCVEDSDIYYEMLYGYLLKHVYGFQPTETTQANMKDVRWEGLWHIPSGLDSHDKLLALQASNKLCAEDRPYESILKLNTALPASATAMVHAENHEVFLERIKDIIPKRDTKSFFEGLISNKKVDTSRDREDHDSDETPSARPSDTSTKEAKSARSTRSAKDSKAKDTKSTKDANAFLRSISSRADKEAVARRTSTGYGKSHRAVHPSKVPGGAKGLSASSSSSEAAESRKHTSRSKEGHAASHDKKLTSHGTSPSSRHGHSHRSRRHSTGGPTDELPISPSAKKATHSPSALLVPEGEQVSKRRSSAIPRSSKSHSEREGTMLSPKPHSPKRESSSARKVASERKSGESLSIPSESGISQSYATSMGGTSRCIPGLESSLSIPADDGTPRDTVTTRSAPGVRMSALRVPRGEGEASPSRKSSLRGDASDMRKKHTGDSPTRTESRQKKALEQETKTPESESADPPKPKQPQTAEDARKALERIKAMSSRAAPATAEKTEVERLKAPAKAKKPGASASTSSADFRAKFQEMIRKK